MKILHLYKDYHPIPGGIENHIKTLAELQAADGHQVTVLVTNPGGEPGVEHIHSVLLIRASRLITLASTPLSISMALKLARQSPDITHLHFPYPVAEISQLLAGRGRPFVITYHSDVVRQKLLLHFYRPVLRRVLQQAARILPTSDRYMRTSPFLHHLAEKCTVVPLSVDPAPYRRASPLIAANSRPSLVFMGRHRYYKGLADLIRAMPQIPARLLVGGEGPMRPAWEQTARQAGVADRVHFLGHISQEDLPGFYASGDAFVLPANARAEAFGTVLLEAMAAGLPCVTTEVGTGTSFVVQDGVSGFVVPPEDPAALAVAIRKLLDDPDLRARMGSSGRERVQREFSPQKLLRNVLRVYQDVLG